MAGNSVLELQWPPVVTKRTCEWCSSPCWMKNEFPRLCQNPWSQWPADLLLDLQYCEDCVVEYHRIRDDVVKNDPQKRKNLWEGDVQRLTLFITKALQPSRHEEEKEGNQSALEDMYNLRPRKNIDYQSLAGMDDFGEHETDESEVESEDETQGPQPVEELESLIKREKARLEELKQQSKRATLQKTLEELKKQVGMGSTYRSNLLLDNFEKTQLNMDNVAQNLNVPLLEILQFPQLLFNTGLAKLFLNAITILIDNGTPLILREKYPGIYMLLVHPAQKVKKWATKTTLRLTRVSSDDYDMVKDAIQWMVGVLTLNRFDNDILLIGEQDVSSSAAAYLPSHLCDLKCPLEFWKGFTKLLLRLEGDVLCYKVLGVSGYRDLPDTILNAVENKGWKSLFWAAFTCLVIILERCGPRIWPMVTRQPLQVFNIITSHSVYCEELNRYKHGPQTDEQIEQGCSQDGTPGDIQRGSINTAIGWFQPFVLSVLDYGEVTVDCVTEVIQFLEKLSGQIRKREIIFSLCNIVSRVVHSGRMSSLVPTADIWVTHLVKLSSLDVKNHEVFRNIVLPAQETITGILTKATGDEERRLDLKDLDFSKLKSETERQHLTRRLYDHLKGTARILPKCKKETGFRTKTKSIPYIRKSKTPLMSSAVQAVNEETQTIGRYKDSSSTKGYQLKPLKVALNDCRNAHQAADFSASLSAPQSLQNRIPLSPTSETARTSTSTSSFPDTRAEEGTTSRTSEFLPSFQTAELKTSTHSTSTGSSSIPSGVTPAVTSTIISSTSSLSKTDETTNADKISAPPVNKSASLKEHLKNVGSSKANPISLDSDEESNDSEKEILKKEEGYLTPEKKEIKQEKQDPGNSPGNFAQMSESPEIQQFSVFKNRSLEKSIDRLNRIRKTENFVDHSCLNATAAKNSQMRTAPSISTNLFTAATSNTSSSSSSTSNLTTGSTSSFSASLTNNKSSTIPDRSHSDVRLINEADDKNRVSKHKNRKLLRKGTESSDETVSLSDDDDFEECQRKSKKLRKKRSVVKRNRRRESSDTESLEEQKDNSESEIDSDEPLENLRLTPQKFRHGVSSTSTSTNTDEPMVKSKNSSSSSSGRFRFDRKRLKNLKEILSKVKNKTCEVPKKDNKSKVISPKAGSLESERCINDKARPIPGVGQSEKCSTVLVQSRGDSNSEKSGEFSATRQHTERGTDGKMSSEQKANNSFSITKDSTSSATCSPMKQVKDTQLSDTKAKEEVLYKCSGKSTPASMSCATTIKQKDGGKPCEISLNEISKALENNGEFDDDDWYKHYEDELLLSEEEKDHDKERDGKALEEAKVLLLESEGESSDDLWFASFETEQLNSGERKDNPEKQQGSKLTTMEEIIVTEESMSDEELFAAYKTENLENYEQKKQELSSTLDEKKNEDDLTIDEWTEVSHTLQKWTNCDEEKDDTVDKIHIRLTNNEEDGGNWNRVEKCKDSVKDHTEKSDAVDEIHIKLTNREEDGGNLNKGKQKNCVEVRTQLSPDESGSLVSQESSESERRFAKLLAEMDNKYGDLGFDSEEESAKTREDVLPVSEHTEVTEDSQGMKKKLFEELNTQEDFDTLEDVDTQEDVLPVSERTEFTEDSQGMKKKLFEDLDTQDLWEDYEWDDTNAMCSQGSVIDSILEDTESLSSDEEQTNEDQDPFLSPDLGANLGTKNLAPAENISVETPKDLPSPTYNPLVLSQPPPPSHSVSDSRTQKDHCFQEKPAVVGSSPPFKPEALCERILSWHVSWLDARREEIELYSILERMEKLPKTFDSLTDYCRRFAPILAVEAWEQAIKEWKESPQRKITAFVKNVNTNHRFSTINAWRTNVRHSAVINRTLPEESQLVILKCEGCRLFGLVDKVEQEVVRDRGSSSSDVGESSEKTFNVKFAIRILRRANFRPPESSEVEITVVASMLTTLRRWCGLVHFHQSLLARDILRPRSQIYFCQSEIPKQVKPSKLYNESQSKVIHTAAEAIHQAYTLPRICLVQGPPGTGKSHTIVGIVSSILNHPKAHETAPMHSELFSEKPKILLCAPSNEAIDELIRKFIDTKPRRENVESNKENRRATDKDRNARGENYNNCGDFCLIRVGRKSKISDSVKQMSLESMTRREMTKRNSGPEEHTTSNIKDQLKLIEHSIDAVERKKYILSKEETATATEEKIKERKLQELENEKFSLISQKKELERYYRNQKEKEKGQRRMETRIKREILNSADIICTTLSGSGSTSLLNDLRGVNGKKIPFSCVIVDEACQCCELDVLIPLQYHSSKLILVGDPEQLSATVLSRDAKHLLYGRSMFDRLYRVFKPIRRNERPVHLLSTQYRMHPEIAYFPSKHFYNDNIHTDSSLVKRVFPVKFPYAVFDVNRGRETNDNGGSISNAQEAEMVSSICHFLIVTLGLHPSDIGIITPYRTQRAKIQALLSDGSCRDIEVKTVDGFQGGQKNVIIMSCVRTGNNIGFLDDTNRLNVALTRAQHALYIFGHMDTLKNYRGWGDMLKDASTRKLVFRVDAGEDVIQVVSKAHPPSSPHATTHAHHHPPVMLSSSTSVKMLQSNNNPPGTQSGSLFDRLTQKNTDPSEDCFDSSKMDEHKNPPPLPSTPPPIPPLPTQPPIPTLPLPPLPPSPPSPSIKDVEKSTSTERPFKSNLKRPLADKGSEYTKPAKRIRFGMVEINTDGTCHSYPVGDGEKRVSPAHLQKCRYHVERVPDGGLQYKKQEKTETRVDHIPKQIRKNPNPAKIHSQREKTAAADSASHKQAASTRSINAQTNHDKTSKDMGHDNRGDRKEGHKTKVSVGDKTKVPSHSKKDHSSSVRINAVHSQGHGKTAASSTSMPMDERERLNETVIRVREPQPVQRQPVVIDTPSGSRGGRAGRLHVPSNLPDQAKPGEPTNSLRNWKPYGGPRNRTAQSNSSSVQDIRSRAVQQSVTDNIHKLGARKRARPRLGDLHPNKKRR